MREKNLLDFISHTLVEVSSARPQYNELKISRVHTFFWGAEIWQSRIIAPTENPGSAPDHLSFCFIQ